MAFQVIDRMFLVVYGERDPTDEEWIEYLKAIERHGVTKTLQLVCTEGGGPTPVQRRYLNELLAGQAVPVAVMSGCPHIRGVVTALGWFNRRIRAFRPGGLHEVLAYLEVPQGRLELIRARLERLRTELGPPEPPAPSWGARGDPAAPWSIVGAPARPRGGEGQHGGAV